MKPQRVYTDYLRDMLEYALKAERFVYGVEFDAFRANDEKVLAVTRALEVIGEAARHIPKELRDRYPDVQWKGITGMRDKAIHDYLGVDLEVVWRTVHESLPQMRQDVARMLADLEAQERGVQGEDR